MLMLSKKAQQTWSVLVEQTAPDLQDFTTAEHLSASDEVLRQLKQNMLALESQHAHLIFLMQEIHHIMDRRRR